VSTIQKTFLDIRDWTILIADDDIQILALLRKHLTQPNIRLLEASDGAEALRIAKEEHPDLVILDVMMPSMSGWEVCRALREDPGTSSLGIIMLTGIGERLNDMTSPLYGADAHLDKPFEFPQLDQVINRVLEERSEGKIA
jgi:DNA-binding response OmpR family regulator